jgi:hypothetical protein
MGLCQHEERGNWMLPMSSWGLEKLFDDFRGLLIIFHHQDHSCIVRF